MDTSPRMTSARLDRWLWAARFFKTRGQAAEAVDRGKVQVNGERAKRARALRPGDQVRLRAGPFEYRVAVRALATRRGSAAAAAELYEEEPDSRATRDRLQEQHRLAARLTQGSPIRGRPTKKDRRELERIRDRESGIGDQE